MDSSKELHDRPMNAPGFFVDREEPKDNILEHINNDQECASGSGTNTNTTGIINEKSKVETVQENRDNDLESRANDIESEEAQVNKALESISEYAKLIKNFMNLDLHKNADSDDKIKNLNDHHIASPPEDENELETLEELRDSEKQLKHVEKNSSSEIQKNYNESETENKVETNDELDTNDQITPNSDAGDEISGYHSLKENEISTTENCRQPDEIENNSIEIIGVNAEQNIVNDENLEKSNESDANMEKSNERDVNNEKSNKIDDQSDGNIEKSNENVEKNEENTENSYKNDENAEKCNKNATNKGGSKPYTRMISFEYPYEGDNESQDRTIPSESFIDDNKPARNHSKKRKFVVHVSELDPDTVCGLGSFKPQWLQKYATAKTYLVFYSILGVLQGAYFTYLIGCLTTIEKRYAFKSKIGGAIMMLDEITPLLLGVLVGYFGGKAHRPRVVAIGMFLSSLCCLISALPYFMYGTSQHLVASYVKNDTSLEYCDRTIKQESCDVDDRPPTLSAVACFFLGSFFKGFGNLAYYAVGLSYMDDNAKKKNTPLYFAILSALRMLGPIVGFSMSSAFLRYYENPFGDPGYGPEDPRWIGAWWLGFALQGVLLFIFSFPLLLFPRRLPRQRQRALSNTKNFAIESNKERMKGLTSAVIRLLKNPVFTFFTFGTIFSITGGYGYYTMLPKYLEIQFQISASNASLLSGPPCITSGIIMIIIGGAAIYALRPRAKILITCQGLMEIFWIVGCFILMLPKCRDVLMAGTFLSQEGLQLTNDCNSECLCTTTAFNPVCGPDGVSNYFSPCHAGCTNGEHSNSEFLGDCSCVFNNGSFIASDDMKRGLCPVEGCWAQAIIYTIILTVLSALLNIFRVAHMMILLRCVEPQDKSLALGLFETCLCTFAFIPLPLIFGSLADAACLVWEKSCGETGNCWLYDVDRFNYLLHGTSAFFTVLAVICYIVVIFKSHTVRDLYEEDDLDFASSKKNRSSSESKSEQISVI